MDTSKMFHEPVYFLYCCITAKFGETENSLLRNFGCLCWTYLKETFHINRACRLTTDQVPLPLRFLCLYSCIIYVCQYVAKHVKTFVIS